MRGPATEMASIIEDYLNFVSGKPQIRVVGFGLRRASWSKLAQEVIDRSFSIAKTLIGEGVLRNVPLALIR